MLSSTVMKTTHRNRLDEPQWLHERMPLIFIPLCSSELAQRPFHLQAKWSKSQSSQIELISTGTATDQMSIVFYSVILLL